MDIRFIDLFAGIGGIRLGLEQAIKANGNNPIIAFWDGKSRGTKFTIDLATEQNKPVKIVQI